MNEWSGWEVTALEATPGGPVKAERREVHFFESVDHAREALVVKPLASAARAVLVFYSNPHRKEK